MSLMRNGTQTRHRCHPHQKDCCDVKVTFFLFKLFICFFVIVLFATLSFLISTLSTRNQTYIKLY